MSNSILHTSCAAILLFTLGTPGFASSPASEAGAGDHPPFPAGVHAVPVPSRSGADHDTWDLGPDPDHPGLRRYATSLHANRQPARVTTPGRLGEAPLAWTFADGRRIEWAFLFDKSVPLRMVDAPTDDGPEAASGLAPLPGSAEIRTAGAATELALNLPIAEVKTRLRLDTGLRAALADAGHDGVQNRLVVRDERGATVLTFALPGARLEWSGDTLTIRRAAAAAVVEGASVPPVITASIFQAGSWGGYQCRRVAAVGGAVSGSGANGNPYGNIYVGEYDHLSGTYSSYHCDGYILFDLSSIPASATLAEAQLYPFNVATFTGAGQNVTVRDVDNGRTLQSTTGYGFDANYYTDFRTMYGGNPAYAVTLVNAVGSVNLALNSQAVMDAMNRLRGQNYFAVGFDGSATSAAPNNYMRLDSGASSLFVYWVDFDPNQVVFSQVFPGAGYSNFWLYNYGEDVDLSGWQIQSINWAGTTQTYTIPAATTLKRHTGLRILDTTGTSTTGTLYTGGGVFLWAQGGASPYYVRLSLLRSAAGGGGSADYFCWGTSAPPAPPAGAGWNGGCITSGVTAFGGSFVRTHDSDADGPGDWANDFASSDSSQALPAGLTGARRRSDVIINHFMAFSTTYDWISIANYGPPVNLQGWSLAFYSASDATGVQQYGHYDGKYTFPSTPLNTGDVVWLAPGTATFPAYHALDTWHQNMDTLVPSINWTYAPIGGEIILNDEADQGRDYAVFGEIHTMHVQPELGWTGPMIPVTGATPDVIRDSDLSTLSSDGWVQQAGNSNWGSLGPSAQGALRVQDEIGGARQVTGYYSYGAGGAFGAGPVVNVTQQVGLENFSIQAAPVSGPLNATLVVKKQGSGTVFKTITLANPIAEIGQTYVSSGLISPPLVLDPGTYAFMLYMNGNWYDAELLSSAERLTFGAFGGYSTEAGYTPTASFSVGSAWAPHAFFSTIAPPVITSAIPLPIGVQSLAYSYAHTSSGGYGASRTWSILSGALPPGLSMNSAGLVSGTPTTPGIYDFTVKVLDGAGLYRTRDESITINVPLAVATSALQAYDSGSPMGWGVDLQPLGGKPPYSWTCGGLPSGFSCPASGQLTAPGPVTAANGTYPITVQVTDGNGSIASRSLGLTVYTTMTILTASLADGYTGIDYGNQRLSVAGGNSNGTITWALAAGYTLPAGLSVQNDFIGGYLAGTPTAAPGTYSTRLQVTNSLSGTVARSYTIAIATATVPDYWIRRGLAGGDVHQLYFSPHFAQDGVVAALAGGTLYVSQDHGYYWRQMKIKPQRQYDTATNRFLDDNFFGVSFDPLFDGRPGQGNKTLVVSASASGLWVSTDFDQTWNKLNYTCNSALFYDPGVAGTAYCLKITGSPAQSLMFRTTGGLANWAQWGNQNLNTLVMSPTFATDHTFFGFDSGDPLDTIKHGLYRSEDSGRHWTMVQSYGNNGGVPYDPVLSPNYATDHVVALIGPSPANNPVMLSFDGGLTFQDQSMLNIMPVFFPPDYNVTTNRKLYGGQSLSGGAQLVVSSDNGVTFSPTGTGGFPPALASRSFTLSPDFLADNTIFGFGGQSSGMYRSADRGKTWGPSDAGLYLQRIRSVAFAPNYASGAGKSFVATAEGLYYSNDGGTTWKPAAVPAGETVTSIVPSPAFASDNTVYAAGYTSGSAPVLLRSTDGGLNYADYNASLPDAPFYPDELRIAPDFATSHTLFLSGYDSVARTGRLYKSTDYGATFSAVGVATLSNPSRFGVSPGYSADQSIYINGYSGGNIGQVSINGGASFSTLAGAPGGYEPPAFAPNYNRAAALSGTNHTLFWNCKKSTDAAGSWTTLSAYACGTLAVSPNYPSDLTFFSAHRDYTGATAEGLFKFTNGGTSSVQVAPASDPTAFEETTQVALSPAYGTDQTLMVGTSAGLYISKDGGATFVLSTGTSAFSDNITSAAQDPNRSGRLYLGSSDAGIAYSSDDGISYTSLNLNLPIVNGVPTAIRSVMAVDDISTGLTGDTVLLASTANGLYRLTINSAGTPGASWALRVNTTAARALSEDGTNCYLAHAGSFSYRAPLSGGCLSWSSFTLNSEQIGYSSLNGPTVPLTGPAPKSVTPTRTADLVTTGSGDPYWAANLTGGATHSPTGTTWTPAPGMNDYQLPATSGYTTVVPMGLTGGLREVALGHSTLGVFLSKDGGDTWRNVSGTGSGLEATSKNVSAFLTAATAYSTTDVLVGVTGSTTGGVYLSGDGGEHWTQVNQGFDPNNLSISTLVKTACAGCAVQYYSGTFGGGLYTRTITVNKPPFFDTGASWCTGAGCTCGTGAFTGPATGGTSFKLCGSNLQTGATVEFDGAPAVGCATSGGTTPNLTTIVCTTPPHVADVVSVRVRNPDTRAKILAQPYTYTAAADIRIVNTLKLSKSGANGNLSWNCTLANCPATNPARVYRAQDVGFTQYPEYFNGGSGGTMTGGCANAPGNNSCYMDATGIMSNGRSYFWVVQ